MHLAKVKGNIVSTQKDTNLKGHKLLIVQPVDLNGEYIGSKDVIALDELDAGIGDTVLLMQEGSSARQILGNSKTPVHSVIVAIVDKIDLKN